MTGMGRNDILDDIITLLKAGTSTNLAALVNNAIQYGLRTSGQIFAVQYRKGILVSLGQGTMVSLTMGGSKQDLTQSVQVVVYCVGHDATADERYIVTTAEEIEAVLWTKTNLILAHGARLIAEPNAWFVPPEGNTELTLHWAVLEFKYQFTGVM